MTMQPLLFRTDMQDLVLLFEVVDHAYNGVDYQLNDQFNNAPMKAVHVGCTIQAMSSWAVCFKSFTLISHRAHEHLHPHEVSSRRERCHAALLEFNIKLLSSVYCLVFTITVMGRQTVRPSRQTSHLEASRTYRWAKNLSLGLLQPLQACMVRKQSEGKQETSLVVYTPDGTVSIARMQQTHLPKPFASRRLP